MSTQDSGVSRGLPSWLLMFGLAVASLLAWPETGRSASAVAKRAVSVPGSGRPPTLMRPPLPVAKALGSALSEGAKPRPGPLGALPIKAQWSGRGCTAPGCHLGIEPIRQRKTQMMRQILARGAKAGDVDGCVVCHGGTVGATDAAAAHQGTAAPFLSGEGPKEFYPDPSSPWVNEQSCGQCHQELVQAQWSSLMMSEAGKIQGTAWGFGGLEQYEHRWANYPYKNPEDLHSRLGTAAYRAYMSEKTRAHPNVFVNEHTVVPSAPELEDLARLKEEPELAGYTYLRAECQRCHLGVKGRSRRGDFRGMGCGACHIPYGNEGLYEGGDQTIPRDQPGHPLVHSLQGSRNARVEIHGQHYTGIPVESCSTCHNRGKRIGVSYQGLMESAYGSPYTEGGGGQIGLHSKHYIAMEKDVHYQKGMLCQDCHTSGDVHGDRFIAAANLAAVEIECTDCHGTPGAFPWELPLGWGDENAPGSPKGPARGVARDLPSHLKRSYPKAPQDGYALTARGNPMPDVERVGDQLVIHTAGGKDLSLTPLKGSLLRNELSPAALTAMVRVDKHMETMECYTCHSSWAPQCYGCHIEVDYSESKRSFDWVQAGNQHRQAGHAADRGESGYDTYIPGEVRETRSYLRWENPVLGVNGEGRVSPLIPGCQTSLTVRGKDGETLALNKIFKGPKGSEGAEEGQLGSDMSPVHPHTVGKSRSCESCHASGKALGYGIEGIADWGDRKVVDLTTADGRVLPRQVKTQIESVPGLTEWSRVVTPEGKQTQTVGHHFKGSGPLSAQQRANMDRRGTCVACHEQIPDGDMAFDALHQAALAADQVPTTNAQHQQLVKKVVRFAAWGQVLGAAALGVAVTTLGGWWWRRRRAAGD